MTSTGLIEQPVRKTDSSTEFQGEDAAYYCNSERHLQAVHFVYSHALRVSKKSGKFYGSQLRLAKFFRRSPTTIWRAFKKVKEMGFFELIASGDVGIPNCYRVLEHDEWAKKYPGKCVPKEEFPWSPENDLLGQFLYSLSGGRVKWQKRQIDALRKSGRSADEVGKLFTNYWDSIGKNMNAKYVPMTFLKYLKSVVP